MVRSLGIVTVNGVCSLRSANAVSRHGPGVLQLLDTLDLPVYNRLRYS